MGAFLSLAHQVLELGKELLDGIEIGTVRRQEEEMGAGVADRGAGGFAFVRTEIVEDDDVARRQGRRQKLFDISGEQRAVDRSVEDARGLDAVAAQSGDEGHRHPVTVRHRGGQPLASGAPAAQRRHVGLDPRLVEKDEAAWIDPVLIRLPATALAGDVRAVLLRRQHGFF